MSRSELRTLPDVVSDDKGRLPSPGTDSVASDEPLVKPIRTWRGTVWDTWELPPKERKLLFKVDAFVLTFASLGYFIKNLDQSNINNAILSGMEEDLNMTGNQLVTAVSIWTVGYVVGQIPSNLLLTRISPRWVIPTLELFWGVFTMSSCAVKSYKALYVLRFFVGLFESGFYPGIHFLLGSWYTPREIGKRAMIFWLSGLTGTLFSGFLQAAAYTNLDGTSGRAGWRWLFIIDGIITLPIAVLGYLFLPNLPLNGDRTWWTTEEEHELARERLLSIGRRGKEPWSWAKLKRLASSWHIWILPLLYVIWNNGSPQLAMGYWLKSFNKKPPPVPGHSYTIPQINNLPLVTTGIFIPVAASWAWLSDGALKGRRWPFIYLGAVLTLIFSILLRQMPLYTHIKARTVVYWLSNIGGGAGPLIFSWFNEISFDNAEERALTIALGNDLAYVVQAVAPNFVWKTTDFPRARKGYTWSIVLQVLLILYTVLVQYLVARENRNRSLRDTGGDNFDQLGHDSPLGEETRLAKAVLEEESAEPNDSGTLKRVDSRVATLI